MKKLLLHSSSLAQWQHLIHSVSVDGKYNLSIELESYLVFLLMRFINNTKFLNNTIALDYLESLQSKLSLLNKDKLQNIGDECLITSGLFPGKAKKRRVSISYYVNIGKHAYEILSHLEDKQEDKLFTNLSQNFVALMDILLSLRQEQSNLSLLEAYQLWEETRSQHSAQLIKQNIPSITNIPIIATQQKYGSNILH